MTGTASPAVVLSFPRRGRRYEGEGDPLRRRGLPLPFTPPPWAFHGISSLYVLGESLHNLLPPFRYGMGRTISIWTKTRGGWSLPKAERQLGEAHFQTAVAQLYDSLPILHP